MPMQYLCTGIYQDASVVSVEAEDGRVNRLVTSQASPSLRRDIRPQRSHALIVTLRFWKGYFARSL